LPLQKAVIAAISQAATSNINALRMLARVQADTISQRASMPLCGGRAAKTKPPVCFSQTGGFRLSGFWGATPEGSFQKPQP